MNLRTALLLGLAGVAASTSANAHMIAVDSPLTGIVTRPIERLSAADVARPGTLDVMSSGGSPLSLADSMSGAAYGAYFLADGARNRRDEKGTWGFQFHRDAANKVIVAPGQGAAAAPITDAVSVPEPATLGLMGVGLLLLGVATRRARVLLHRPASIA